MSYIRFRKRYRWLSGFLAFCFASLQCIPPASAGQFRVFGKTYVRGTGSPQTVTDAFAVLNPAGSWLLRAINGDLEDASVEKVSSSTLLLNGIEVLKSNQFSQNVSLIEESVSLQGTNTLATTLKGKPGGRLSVEILGQDEELPVISIGPPLADVLFASAEVFVRITASDDMAGLDPASFQVSSGGTDLTSAFAPFSPTLNLVREATVSLAEGA